LTSFHQLRKRDEIWEGITMKQIGIAIAGHGEIGHIHDLHLYFDSDLAGYEKEMKHWIARGYSVAAIQNSEDEFEYEW
jgi:hypothetical protein